MPTLRVSRQPTARARSSRGLRDGRAQAPTIAGSSLAGRLPRKASVTWSVLPRHDRPPRRRASLQPRARRGSSEGVRARGRAAGGHRLRRYLSGSCVFVPTSCQDAAREMERSDGRARADRLPVGGQREVLPPARRRGPTTWMVDEPDGLLRRPAARARDAGHGDRRRRRRAAARTPAAIAAATSAETAPCAARSSSGTPSSPVLTLVRVGDDAAREDVARARDGGEPRGDEPARARLGGREGEAAARGTARARAPATGRSSSANRYRSSGSRKRACERVRARLRARLDDEVDVDLEVARADRRLDAVAVAAGVGERLRHRGLARAEEPEHPALGRRRAAEHAPHRLALERARPQPPQLPRRAGQHDDDARARCRARARAPCRRSRATTAPSGSVACFVTPRRSRAYGRRRRSANRAGDRLDLAPRALGRHGAAAPATRATSSTVRSSCVGPSPPETRHTSASKPAAQRRLEVGGIVADDQDPRRLSPSASASARRTARCRSVRSPRTSSLPVTTIAARGRALTPLTAVAPETVSRPAARAGTPAVDLDDDVAAARDRERQRLRREALELPLLERAACRAACREAPAHLHERRALDGARPQHAPAVRRARRRRPRGVAALTPVDLRLVVAAEAPRRDHERRHEQDRGQRDRDGAATRAARGADAAARRGRARRGASRPSSSSPAT